MKKGWKKLLTGFAVAAAGFVAYTLWEEHKRKTELAQRAAEGPEFIERRKACERVKDFAKTAAADPSPLIRQEPQISVVKPETSPVDPTGESACAAAHTEQVEPLPHISDSPLEEPPEAVDSAHVTDTP